MLRKMFKYFIFREKRNSKSYVNYLRKQGCNIGKNVSIFYPTRVCIDLTRPWLISIGDNVQITENVTILTHGYDWSVLKGKYGEICGSSGKVIIGNNVFIGMKSTILKGVKIGNNVIIGANSLVNKDIPDNVVIAGNPAKIIMTLDEYYNKRIKKQLEEAVECSIEYYKTYGTWPKKELLREFIFLFENRDQNIDNNSIFKEIGSLVANYDETKNKFYSTKSQFSNYDDFIEYCKNNLIKQKKN